MNMQIILSYLISDVENIIETTEIFGGGQYSTRPVLIGINQDHHWVG